MPDATDLYGDIYFMPGTGPQEKDHVFLKGNGIYEKFGRLSARNRFTIAELGFGTGLSFFLTMEAFRRYGQGELRFLSVEKHPLPYREMVALSGTSGPEDISILSNTSLYPGWNVILFPGNIRMYLYIGDVLDFLKSIPANIRPDAWYPDGFSPDKNPAMWSDEVFRQLSSRSKPGASLATFSVARMLRDSLTANGWQVQKAPGFGRKREMTVAVFPGVWTPELLPEKLHIGIVGAGIAGASLAFEATAGGHEVTVIEKHAPASGASGNPVGVVKPKFDAGATLSMILSLAGFAYARRLFLKDPQFRDFVKQVPVKESFDADDRNILRWQKIRTLISDMVPDLPVHIDTKACQVIYDEAMLVDPAGLISILLTNVHQVKAEVHRLSSGEDGVLLTSSAGDLRFDRVFLANGSEITDLWPAAPVRRNRGQLIWFPSLAIPGNFTLMNKVYLTGEWSGHPRLLGASNAEWDANPDIRVSDSEQLWSRLREIPGVEPPDSHLPDHQARVSFRATTADRLPVLVSADNISAITGLGSRGFSWGPLLSMMMIRDEMLFPRYHKWTEALPDLVH